MEYAKQFVNILTWLLFAAILTRSILSWIVPEEPVDPRLPQGKKPEGDGFGALRLLQAVTEQITEPILGPVRRILPDFGGLDISPVLVIIVIFIIRGVVL